MIFRVTFKDPDGPSECLQEEAEKIVAAIPGLDLDEREALMESKRRKLGEFAAKWMLYGEYVTIEFDTEAGTATVVRKE